MKKIIVFTLIISKLLFSNDVSSIIFQISQPEHISMFYKDSQDHRYGSIQSVIEQLDQQDNIPLLIMNGGMYHSDHSPVGLYIEDGVIVSPVNFLDNQPGNFFLTPNGIFSISDSTAQVEETSAFISDNSVQYATQSGPMLVINGEIHPGLNTKSQNRQIRNGVGILPSGEILFAISTEPINFYDFALFFKSNNCNNALYLDGYVSQAYIPQKQVIQTGGDFGVIIVEVQ